MWLPCHIKYLLLILFQISLLLDISFLEVYLYFHTVSKGSWMHVLFILCFEIILCYGGNQIKGLSIGIPYTPPNHPKRSLYHLLLLVAFLYLSLFVWTMITSYSSSFFSITSCPNSDGILLVQVEWSRHDCRLALK